MRVRGNIRPGRGVSAFAAILGIVMTIVGLTVIIPIFGPFGTLWTIAAAGMALFHGYNAISDDGVAHAIVDVDVPSSNIPSDSPKDRLQELERLHSEGLVTQAEFDEQRQRILNSL